MLDIFNGCMKYFIPIFILFFFFFMRILLIKFYLWFVDGMKMYEGESNENIKVA